MKRILMAVALAGMCGGVYAADFSDLQNLRASDVKGSAVTISAPEAVTAENVIVDQNGVGRLSDLPGSSPYEKLANLFKEGVPATKEDLTGWYSGRFADDVGGFGAALIVGRPVKNRDGGPLLTLPDEFILDNFSTMWDVPSDYFDRIGANPQAVRKIKGLLPSGEDAISRGVYVQFPEALLASSKGSDHHLYQYRKARGYIVEWHYQEYRFNASKIVYNTYAYYFKNVTPKN